MSDETSKNHVKEAGSTVVLATSARIISQLASLVILILAGRFLNPELFGLFVLATILLNISGGMIYSGVYNYILKEPDLQSHIRTTFTIHIAVGVLFALAICLLSGLVYGFSSANLLGLLILSTAPLPLGFLLIGWCEALLLRHGDVKFYYWSLLTSEMISFVSAVSLLILGFEIWALIIAKYVGTLFLFIIMVAKVRRVPLPGFDMDQARRILSYCLPLYGQNLLTAFTGYGAEVAIGAVLTNRAVGLFRMGVRTSTAAFDVFSQTARVLIWQIVGQLARQKRIYEPIWIKIYAMMVALVGCALGAFAVLARPFTELVLGPEWFGIVTIVQVVCFVRIVAVFPLVANAQLAAAGQTRFVFKVQLFEALTLAAALSLLISFGAVAVAWALLMPVLVSTFLTFRRISAMTTSPFLSFARQAYPSFIIGAGTVATVALARVLLLSQPPLIELVGSSVAGISVMLILIFIVFRDWSRDVIQSLSEALHIADKDQHSISQTSPVGQV